MNLLKKYLGVAAAIIALAMVISGCATNQKKPDEAAQKTPQQTETSAKKDSDLRRPESKDNRMVEETPQAQLQAAREKLEVSEETQKRVQAEFDKLKQSGRISADIAKDYEAYLESLGKLVAENRSMVEKLEAAMATPNQGGMNHTSAEAGPVKTAELDRRLKQSLSEFDDMLLKEMEQIEAQSQRKMTSLAEEAAAAAERLRNKGIDVGGSEGEGTGAESPGNKPETAATEPTEQSGEQATGSGEDGTAPSEKGKSGSTQARTETDGEAGGTQSNDRREVYSEEDDDIVARQLREAAEKETDPQMKKKLWKEYEDYKRNTGQ